LLYCKFPGELLSERILKIGQYLTKFCVDYSGLLYLAHPVYCVDVRRCLCGLCWSGFIPICTGGPSMFDVAYSGLARRDRVLCWVVHGVQTQIQLNKFPAHCQDFQEKFWAKSRRFLRTFSQHRTLRAGLPPLVVSISWRHAGLPAPAEYNN